MEEGQLAGLFLNFLPIIIICALFCLALYPFARQTGRSVPLYMFLGLIPLVNAGMYMYLTSSVLTSVSLKIETLNAELAEMKQMLGAR